MKTIYGILNKDNCHIDTSNTLQGAKNYATRNGYKKVSKRIGYNSQLICKKVAKNWINQNRCLKNISIYDNGGKTIDRITFVFLESKNQDIFGSRYYNYECLCTSLNGTSFFQHSNCQIGKHLGKKIEFKDLSKELQNKINTYLES